MRHITKAYFKGGAIRTHNQKHINGRGIGDVLLDGGNGGMGSGSSYTSLEDYINTTGSDPYKSLGKGIGAGSDNSKKSLASMNSKLENLFAKSQKGKKKEKNITFSI
jgi:hypothetical protein